MLSNLLATDEVTALDKFLSPTGSFCWLVILLAVFALFYLIFCSYYKVNNTVKLIGWCYSAFMIICDIVILAVKLDIFTLGSVLFSAMLLMAIISIVLPNNTGGAVIATTNSDQTEQKPANVGSYVVRELENGRTCFELYDRSNKFIVRSHYCYKDVQQAMEQIEVTRENGKIAALQDRTAQWIQEADHPKFEMYRDGEKFFFHLAVNGKYVILKSKGYDDLATCKVMLKKAMKAVLSEKVYRSVELLNAEEAQFTSDRYYESNSSIVRNPEATPEEKPEEKTSTPEVIPQAVQEEVAVTTNDEPESTENGVVFSNEVLTLWDRYALLDKDGKRFFDEIRKKAQSIPTVKENETRFYLSYKIKRDLLVKLLIKRGVVETVFMLIDPKFKEHLNGYDDVKVAETPTPIKVENEAYLNVVLETIDLRYATLEEQQKQREEARRLAKNEARRARRAEQKNSENIIEEA